MEGPICIGCGGQLQNTDSSKPYYTPKEITNDTICQRCFRLKHYHESYVNLLDAEAYRALIGQLASRDILVVMVVDIFDLEGSALAQIHKLTGHNDVLVIVNKRDILPKNVSDQKLRHRIKKRLSEIGIKALDVVLVSALKKQNIDEAIEVIAIKSQSRDIYVVGATNVGKSTLINSFIQSVSSQSNQPITVSNYRGTTQGFIPIPFEEQTLYDTPGLYNKNHISELISDDDYQTILPKKEIKPKIFQLHEEQTIFITGLARVDIKPKGKVALTVYAGHKAILHRRKLAGSDDFHKKHIGDLLSPPKAIDHLEFTQKTFHLNHQKSDIVIPGLSILTFKGACEVTVHLPRSLTAYEREALI